MTSLDQEHAQRTPVLKTVTIAPTLAKADVPIQVTIVGEPGGAPVIYSG
jgi:hypothetical protein